MRILACSRFMTNKKRWRRLVEFGLKVKEKKHEDT